MSWTSPPRKSISGSGLPSQVEAQAVFQRFKKMLEPATEQQIRGMLSHWNDIGLVLDSKVDHGEYIAACVKDWQQIPAVFIAWAQENWELQSNFFPKPANLLKLAEPHLAKWRQTYVDLDKAANWEREKPFVKQGTVESRRAIIAASLKRGGVVLDDAKAAKGQAHG